MSVAPQYAVALLHFIFSAVVNGAIAARMASAYKMVFIIFDR